MGRYDQKVDKKYSSKIMMIVFIVISIIVVIWLFQKKNQVSDAVNSSIEIPIKKPVSGVDADAQKIDDSPISGLNEDKQIVVSPTTEEIVDKFELMKLEESDDSFRDGIKKVSENLINWFDYKNETRIFSIYSH